MRVNEILKNEGFPMGRMVSLSKSDYRDANPKSVVWYNANIITIDDGKVWFGDLDLTKDSVVLKRVANTLGKTLFILKEMDGRFENENVSGIEQIKKAVWDTTKETPFK